MNDAEYFSSRLNHDRRTFKTPEGDWYEGIARSIGATLEQRPGCQERWTFPDGSVIVILDEGWDFEGDAPWTWRSVTGNGG